MILAFPSKGLANINVRQDLPTNSRITAPDNEIRSLAIDWMQAWTDLDADKMAEMHDPRLLYYWRGKPDSAEEFLDAFENFVIPNAPEEPVP